MANSDYQTTATSMSFCPNGILGNAVSEYQTVIPLSSYREVGDDPVLPGEAAMINDEIVKVVSFSTTSVTVERGCADTIPQAHDTGSVIWFFNNAIGTDSREYAGSETISVKLLPRTTTQTAPVADSEPNEVTFNFRFARPYPPGKVEVNGQPFTSMQILAVPTPNIVFTWAHRNRVTQFDQLVDHLATSVTPEVGTTYTIKVYKSDNTLKRTVDNIAGTTWTYDSATALTDFGITASAGSSAVTEGYVTIESVRDGYSSYQRYKIPFRISHSST